MVFPWFFLQFGLGGAGVQIVETRIFLRGTVMKASSHEKHSKQQWKKQKKSSDPWARSGRGLAGDMGLNFLFFLFFHGFLQFGQKPREHKKKSSDPWARSELSTHKPKNQKNKKPKNQETKKTKNQKKQKNQDCTPQGEGVRCRVLGLVFLFFFVFFWFFGFLVSWFFGFFVFLFFLVCVWIAIADVPSRDCQALSVVALEVGQAKTKKPKNQETKKTKKTKKQKNKKKTDCTPKGRGSDAECWVLSFWFVWFFLFFVFLFFVFLVFCFFCLCVDSHCRCAKQRLPGTVSGCTRSKVDTLQYSNVCYDIVHSANEQQRGMEFNFVRLRHMLLDLCTGNAAICALPQWPVLFIYQRV